MDIRIDHEHEQVQVIAQAQTFFLTRDEWNKFVEMIRAAKPDEMICQSRKPAHASA